MVIPTSSVPLLRHPPHNHGVSPEPRTTVVQHRAEAAHNLPVLKVLGQNEQPGVVNAQALGHGIEGPDDQRQVFLELADYRLLVLGNRDCLIPVRRRGTLGRALSLSASGLASGL